MLLNLFLIAYSLEASLRKFLFQSQALIAFKLLFLLYFFTKLIPFFSWYQYSVIIITFPLLVFSIFSNPSLANIFYDYYSLALVPIFIYTARYVRFPIRHYTDISFPFLCMVTGVISSLLTILQSLSGRNSFLNISVDGSQTTHVFSSGLIFKASGLASVPTPFFALAGLVSIWYFKKLRLFKPLPLSLLQILILISIPFNIASKTYVIGILFLFVLRFIILSKINKKSLFSYLTLFFVIIFVFILFTSSGSFSLSEAFDTNLAFFFRRFDIFSILERFASNFTFFEGDVVNVKHDFIGLGMIIGGARDSSFSSLLETLPLCRGLLKEWEFSRIICIAGPIYGFLLVVLLKFVFSFQLILYGFKRRFTFPYSSIIYILIGTVTALQYQYYFNDYSTGLIVLSLLACYLDTSSLLYTRKTSKSLDL